MIKVKKFVWHQTYNDVMCSDNGHYKIFPFDATYAGFFDNNLLQARYSLNEVIEICQNHWDEYVLSLIEVEND